MWGENIINALAFQLILSLAFRLMCANKWPIFLRIGNKWSQVCKKCCFITDFIGKISIYGFHPIGCYSLRPIIYIIMGRREYILTNATDTFVNILTGECLLYVLMSDNLSSKASHLDSHWPTSCCVWSSTGTHRSCCGWSSTNYGTALPVKRLNPNDGQGQGMAGRRPVPVRRQAPEPHQLLVAQTEQSP